MSIVISNTTPLNYLILIEHVDILHDLYGCVIVPEAVVKELQDAETPQEVRDWIASRPSWLEVRKPATPPDESLDSLDQGEREAITLAKELHATALIIDEQDGREEAKRQGLRVIGTLRVLYDAAEQGFCNLQEAFDRLQKTSFHASPKLYQLFLALEEQRRQERG
jgi:predicted nucleic acid-binding protein